MKFLILTLFILICSIDARAGTWNPDPSTKYRLDIEVSHTRGFHPKEKKWAKSLVDGLSRYGKVQEVWHFGKNSAQLYVNGTLVKAEIYKARSKPGQYFISYNKKKFIVTFDTRSILSINCGEQSCHVPPSKNFMVIVSPHGKNITGLGVSGRQDNFIFSLTSAEWY